MGLMQLGIMDATTARKIELPCPKDFSLLPGETLQEVWIDFEVDEKNGNTAAYLYFEHYNGAMSTAQCSRLIEAMDHILAKAATDKTIRAIVLMGGSYFSNGIALNVIEASSDPAQESWININRIDDVVQHLLHEFPSRNITTIAAIRGNAAAGGVALATACDFVIAGSDVVLNPAYRGIGLHGSEFHSLTYTARCGAQQARLQRLQPHLALDAAAGQVGDVEDVHRAFAIGREMGRVDRHPRLEQRVGELVQQGGAIAGVDLDHGEAVGGAVVEEHVGRDGEGVGARARGRLGLEPVGHAAPVGERVGYA